MQNVFLMVGYPASGKSTLARRLASSNPELVILDGDLLKTSEKVVRELKKNLDAGKSVLVDACNHTLERRRAVIDECQKRGIVVYAFFVATEIDECMRRAEKRELEGGPHIPKIAFYTARKKFVLPSLDEGFAGISLSNAGGAE